MEGRPTSILAYRTGGSGWTDELTSFHEDTAGSSHYIDIASRENAARSLQRHLRSPGPVIMDIGCSSGLLLELLRRRLPDATLVGADYVRGPLESLAARMPGVPLLQFDLVSCPLPECSVDAVVALNVLEHIEDDTRALGQIRRILRLGGIAVIEVPAGPNLYDLYDKELLHFRRYSMPELLMKVRKSGLEIVSRSHLGFFLYAPFAVVKKRNQRRSQIGQRKQKEIVASNIQILKDSRVMHAIMSIEQSLRPLVYYPFGIRCVITCRRPFKEE